MPTLSGTSPAPVYGATQALTSLVTASFTPPAGSIVVAKVLAADASTVASTPTGLTFTSRTNAGTSGGSCRVAIFTAVGGGSAVTVTAAFTGTAHPRCLIIEVWTGAQLAGTPAVNNVNRVTNPSAPSSTLTTVAASSIVTWACGDWSAISGATRAYRSSAVDNGYTTTTGEYTAYSAYQQAGAAGAQTYGLTTPTQSWQLGAMEIQDVPVASVRRPPQVRLNAVSRSNLY